MIKNFFNDESGAELAEYAIACAILVAVAIIVLNILGEAIQTKTLEVADEISVPAPDSSSSAGP